MANTVTQVVAMDWTATSDLALPLAPAPDPVDGAQTVMTLDGRIWQSPRFSPASAWIQIPDRAGLVLGSAVITLERSLDGETNQALASPTTITALDTITGPVDVSDVDYLHLRVSTIAGATSLPAWIYIRLSDDCCAGVRQA